MHSHPSPRLTLLFLVLIVFVSSVTSGVIVHAAFASATATSSSTKVVFNGVDANFTNQLWVTDGTSAGTNELTNITYYYNSLNPTNITALGNVAVFRGQNGSGVYGLWVTNGTQNGTYELQNIPNAASSGISPGDITAFGHRALFDGEDASGNDEIWSTDGTAANTKELTSIPTAGNFESSFGDITPFGDQALFTGTDAKGNAGIWVTNGTAAGTQQLSVMTMNGLVYPAGSDLTAFGKKALFDGTINGLTTELWVTDGTPAGTQQLTASEAFDIAPFGNQALFATSDGSLWITDGTPGGTLRLTYDSYDLSPTDITAFGNQALFVGTDANGNNSIWVTNGTILGTQELITVGTNYSNYTNDITAFGNQAVFYAVDANGFGELWTTDGTKTGTKELTSVGSNYYNGLQPYDITVFGNQLLFNGYDAYGNNALWEMSDINAGPQELQNIPGSDTGNFYPSSMTVLSPGNNPLPTGKWLAPLNGFSIQQGNTITLTVEADPGSSGSPITSVSISAAWGNNKLVVCNLAQPDQGTSDEYSCVWNFQYQQGKYIDGGPVTFHATIMDQAGNRVDDPDGTITGTFVEHRISETSNWGGYGAYAPDASQLYSYVGGAWTVPAVKQCAPGETSESSAWVGLGGRGKLETDPLEQIGTDSNCENGTPSYKAWYEMVPLDPVYFVDIKPGDSIDATVEYVGNSQYALSMSINGTVYSYTQPGESSILAQNAAECIQEADTTNKVIDPLTDYGLITFDHCYLVQTSSSGIQTEESINNGPVLVEYYLESQQSDRHWLETVGSLNSTTSNSSFTVTWNATR